MVGFTTERFKFTSDFNKKDQNLLLSKEKFGVNIRVKRSGSAPFDYL